MAPQPAKQSGCDPRQADWCAEKFDALFAKLDHAEKERAAVKKLLTGNGEVGFTERLRRIEDARLNEQTERQNMRSAARRTFWTVITATVVLVVTYFWNLLTAAPK